MAEKVLLVDDDEKLRNLLKEYLEGYGYKVLTLVDGSAVPEKIERESPDIVILDIMGVNGFDLLKTSVKRGFPTVMLTAYALTPESLEKSIKLGAVSFLPKEKMSELDEFLADVVLKGGQPVWEMLFDKLGGFFNKRFGPDWKQRNKFFEDFEQSLQKSKQQDSG